MHDRGPGAAICAAETSSLVKSIMKDCHDIAARFRFETAIGMLRVALYPQFPARRIDAMTIFKIEMALNATIEAARAGEATTGDHEVA